LQELAGDKAGGRPEVFERETKAWSQTLNVSASFKKAKSRNPGRVAEISRG